MSFSYIFPSIPKSPGHKILLIGQLAPSMASSLESAVFQAEPDLVLHEGVLLLRMLRGVFAAAVPVGFRRLVVRLRCAQRAAQRARTRLAPSSFSVGRMTGFWFAKAVVC